MVVWYERQHPHCWQSSSKHAFIEASSANPFSSCMNNEAWTPKTQTHSCQAVRTATNKAGSTENFQWILTPTRPAKTHTHTQKNVNKRRQQDRKSAELGENLRVWERTGRGWERGREGCSFLFTSPKRNPWNTTELSPGPRLRDFSRTVNLELSSANRGQWGSIKCPLQLKDYSKSMGAHAR